MCDGVLRSSAAHPTPLSGPLVARPRLLARLDQGLQRPLTLISAPAGSGKTTLLAQWAATIPVPTARLRLSATDHEPAHLITHLRDVLPSLALDIDGVSQTLRPGADQSPVAIGAALADALSKSGSDIVLIIDDYHLAASSTIEQFVNGVLSVSPSTLHLVLATRSDPVLPLARLRLHGLLAEVRASDLRFTAAETAALLSTIGRHDDTPAWITAILAHTEGWIAGIRMVMLTLDAETPAHSAVPDQHVLEFLLEEVLTKQSAASQDVLLRLAVVDRLSPSLAAALLEVDLAAAIAALEQAVRGGLFLEAEADGEWFHFHALFLRLLRHQLERRYSTEAIARLHLRAGAWFAEHHLLDAAIRHHVEGGDVAGAAHVIVAHVDGALAREDWTTVSRWLHLLPSAVVSQQPALVIARAWVAHLSGRMAPNHDTLAAVESLLAGARNPASSALRQECDVLRLVTMTPVEQEPASAVVRARKALEHLPDERRFPVGQAIFTLGCALHAAGQTDEAVRWLTDIVNQEEARIDAASMRALIALQFIHRQAGQIEAAVAIAQQTLALAEREGLVISRSWAHWTLAWSAYERNSLDEAEHHFRMIAREHARTHLSVACEAQMGLGLIALARGDTPAAWLATEQLQKQILASNALEYLPWARAYEALIALRSGQVEQAMAWLRAESTNAGDVTLHSVIQPYLIRIQILIAMGTTASLREAREGIAAFRAVATSRNATTKLVRVAALEALAAVALGDRAAALVLLRDAIALGRPGDFRRTFLDLGDALLPLLADLDGAAGLAGVPLAMALPAHSAPAAFDLLTVREVEVLAALAQRLTYGEIAERMFISLNTVKRHASNIYAKLGVTGRRAALRRAEELGWVAEHESPPPR
ncbi:MAG: LuxR C-terminal-related transcriptional regulator [Thermomicrobiales bacterium]